MGILQESAGSFLDFILGALNGEMVIRDFFKFKNAYFLSAVVFLQIKSASLRLLEGGGRGVGDGGEGGTRSERSAELTASNVRSRCPLEVD